MLNLFDLLFCCPRAHAGVRSHLREKGIAKKGLVVDANGSRKIPVKAPATRLSVQAASPYDAVEQQVS